MTNYIVPKHSKIKGRSIKETNDDKIKFQKLVEAHPLSEIRQSVLKTIHPEDINNDLAEIEDEVLFAREELFSHCIDLLYYALEVSEGVETISFYDERFPDLPIGSNRAWFEMFLESLDYLAANTALDSKDVESLVFSTQKFIFNLVECGYELPLNLHVYQDHSTGQMNLCHR